MKFDGPGRSWMQHPAALWACTALRAKSRSVDEMLDPLRAGLSMHLAGAESGLVQGPSAAPVTFLSINVTVCIAPDIKHPERRLQAAIIGPTWWLRGSARPAGFAPH
jgi:hypothetical protein